MPTNVTTRGRVLLVIRPLLLGAFFGLTLAALEIFADLLYLQLSEKIEGKYLFNFKAFFLVHVGLGASIGLAVGLLSLLFSWMRWLRKIDHNQIASWQRGFLVGLISLVYSGAVLFEKFSSVGVHWVLITGVGSAFLCLGFVLLFERIVATCISRRKLKVAASVAVAAALMMVFGTVYYWHRKFDFQHHVKEAIASLEPKEEASTSRENIVLITIETLRADHLSAYGYINIRTENIDKLAEEGILFEWMIAQSPWTRPSMGSIWTSSYPSQHGAILKEIEGKNEGYHGKIIDRGLKAGLPTVAETLSKAGYVTAGFNTNHLIDARYGFNRGFQLYIDSPWNLFRYSLLYHTADKLLRSSAFSGFLPLIINYDYISAEGVCEVFEKIISKLEAGGEPFFLWVHLMDPHLPYYPHGENLLNARVYTAGMLEKALDGSSGYSPSLRSDLIKSYDGELLYTDRNIGRILNRLRIGGLYENTLIVLTSDHGEELFDHFETGLVRTSRNQSISKRGYGHGHTLYDELLRVPLIMKLPGKQHRKRRVMALVQHIDLAPTLYGFAGLAWESNGVEHEGIDLLEYLNDEKTFPDRYAFSESTMHGPEIKQVRATDYKLVYYHDSQEVEFYNLSSDPGEQNNLSEKKPLRYPQMLGRLRDWMAKMRKGVPSVTAKDIFVSGETEILGAAIDDKEREALTERLKALGYLQ